MLDKLYSPEEVKPRMLSLRYAREVLDTPGSRPVLKREAKRAIHYHLMRQHANGFLYLIRRQNLLKIGYTTKLAARVKCIEMHCGERVKVVSTLRGNKADEARLHKLFAEYRTIGEWFEIRGELEKFIKTPKASMERALK